MDRKRFRGILDEFPPKFNGFKGLAEVLRRALFPIRDESFFTGAYCDHEQLYKPMIDTISRASIKHSTVYPTASKSSLWDWGCNQNQLYLCSERRYLIYYS